ncbi:MAG: ATP-binding protein, partial [Candidatus Eiseniibacteriota bacterium]
MAKEVPPRTATVSSFLPVAAAVFALVVFVIDTATTLDIAIAVLYVAVVLVSADFLGRRGVLLVSAACLALTVAAYLLSHGLTTGNALLRCFVSLAAITITTVLAVRNLTANETLRKQAQLLDLTHDSVFVRDMSDVVTYWNRGAEQVYGWTGAEAVGRSSHQLLQTVFSTPLETITATLLATGRWEGELMQSRRDGTPIIVSSRWSLQRDDRGRPVAVLETNTDVTESHQAREALNKAQAELAHVTRITTLGELTASIAHEVNQPLAAMVTNAEACLRWLGREHPDMAEVRGAITRIIQDGKRASDVIWRIRALSQKRESEKAPLDLNEITREALPLLQHEVLSHRITLKLELAPGLPPVLGDRIQLQQVMVNLLVNAIQALAPVTDRPRDLVVRTAPKNGDKVLVSVRDSGVGIGASDPDRLFDTFYTTKVNGMGMGLSICRSIIEGHGGRIWMTRND